MRPTPRCSPTGADRRVAGIPQTRSPDAVPGPLPQTHLADTTVWSKVRPRPLLADWFNEEVRSGRIATCDIVVLELLRSARNSQAFVSQSRLLALLPGYPIAAAEWARGAATAGGAGTAPRYPARGSAHCGSGGVRSGAAVALRPRLRPDRRSDRAAGAVAAPRWVASLIMGDPQRAGFGRTRPDAQARVRGRSGCPEATRRAVTGSRVGRKAARDQLRSGPRSPPGGVPG